MNTERAKPNTGHKLEVQNEDLLRKISQNFDISQVETVFPLMEAKLGSRETSIFSLEFTLCLHPTLFSETPLSSERTSNSEWKQEITVCNVLNMGIFLQKRIPLRRS